VKCSHIREVLTLSWSVNIITKC